MRYRLRTLLILLAVVPPQLALGYWTHEEWRRSMVHIEVDASGDVIRVVERPSGRVLAEHPVGHVSLGTGR